VSSSSLREESPPLEGAGGGTRKTQIFNSILNAKIVKESFLYYLVIAQKYVLFLNFTTLNRVEG